MPSYHTVKFANIWIFLLCTFKDSNFHKFCWVITTQPISVLNSFQLYLQQIFQPILSELTCVLICWNNRGKFSVVLALLNESTILCKLKVFWISVHYATKMKHNCINSWAPWVVSWGSEVTPSKTPFFKRAYKISHPPGVSWDALPSFASSAQSAEIGLSKWIFYVKNCLNLSDFFFIEEW